MQGMFNQFNELAKQIHENAVEHGWWEKERKLRQLAALFHSELSEAYEEYRSDNDYEYEVDGKPEGIAPELADYIIRLLDYAGHKGLDIDAALKEAYVWEAAIVNDDFSEFIADCHMDVSRLYHIAGIMNHTEAAGEIARCMMKPISWMIMHKIDPIAVIKRKHAYNKTRPYRHGGKVC